jgi:3-oxoacyl-[acyl-carrier protein] reductase
MTSTAADPLGRPEPVGGEPSPYLQGRVVALTGAGRGLGLLTARELLRQGACLLANYRSRSEELEQLREKYPEHLRLVQGDIAEERTAVELGDVARALGRLDALVHNAGITRDGLLVRMPVEDWDEVQRVNVRGAFLATKYALKPMMRQRYGRLVYISSIAAEMGNAGQANYAASKAALHGLARAVSQEYNAYNIRTVVLAPGLINTGLGAQIPPEVVKAKSDRSLGGIGDAKGVAATIAFLAGPDADFINATVIRTDGGVQY